MPEGYRISLYPLTFSAIEIPEVCLTYTNNVPMLVGEPVRLYLQAGCSGLLYYFAKEQAYGIPLCLETHPGKPRFWWVFKHPDTLEHGRMQGLQWSWQQRHCQPISMANFAQILLQPMLEEKILTEHQVADLNLDEWFGLLVKLLLEQLPVTSEMLNLSPQYVLREDNDGYVRSSLVGHVGCFRDKSKLLLGEEGYIVLSEQRFVPDNGFDKDPNQPKRYRIVSVEDNDSQLASRH